MVFSKAKYADIGNTVTMLRYFAGWADKIQGKTIEVIRLSYESDDEACTNNLPQTNENKFAYTRYEPYGVVVSPVTCLSFRPLTSIVGSDYPMELLDGWPPHDKPVPSLTVLFFPGNVGLEDRPRSCHRQRYRPKGINGKSITDP